VAAELSKAAIQGPFAMPSITIDHLDNSALQALATRWPDVNCHLPPDQLLTAVKGRLSLQLDISYDLEAFAPLPIALYGFSLASYNSNLYL
jgi:hypothetical protein